MKKCFIWFLLLPVFAFGQEKEQIFEIFGRLNGFSFKVERIYLIKFDNGIMSRDSAEVTNNHYHFKGVIAEPLEASLSVKFKNPKANKDFSLRRKNSVLVYLEPGVGKFVSDENLNNIRITGFKSALDFKKLKMLEEPLNKLEEPLNNHIRELRLKQIEFKKKDEVAEVQKLEKAIEQLEAENEQLEAEKRNKIYVGFIKNNPASPVSLYALEWLVGPDMDVEKVNDLFNSLTSAVQELPSGQKLKFSVDAVRKTAIGMPALDFVQADTNGIPVSLSSFRGKYVLLDFWASWCGPCRAENPNLVKLYKRYNKNNFEIIGISLDRPEKKESWMRAIRSDGLIWTQLSDLQFWNNAVAVLYAIKSIPQNFLISPDGIIIAKNLEGKELNEKVAEVLK